MLHSFIFHAVTLGSIQELTAETCSEIKASEGSEMVTKEYWIYSDGNSGEAILARCEGTGLCHGKFAVFWVKLS